MTMLMAARAVHLYIGFVLFWILFYVSGRVLLLDVLRQRLFAIRDSLFDFAADGGIGFEDPAYRELRDDINSLIRFADKMSFGRIAFARMPDDHPAVTSVRDWEARAAQLQPLAKKKLLETRQVALREVMLYLVRRSVVLFAISLLLSVIGLFAEGVRNFNRTLPKLAESLEAQARSNEYRLAS